MNYAQSGPGAFKARPMRMDSGYGWLLKCEWVNALKRESVANSKLGKSNAMRNDTIECEAMLSTSVSAWDWDPYSANLIFQHTHAEWWWIIWNQNRIQNGRYYVSMRKKKRKIETIFLLIHSYVQK